MSVITIAKRLQHGDPSVFDDPDLPLAILAGEVPTELVRSSYLLFVAHQGQSASWIVDIAFDEWRTTNNLRLVVDALDTLVMRPRVALMWKRPLTSLASRVARWFLSSGREPSPELARILEDLEMWAARKKTVDVFRSCALAWAAWHTQEMVGPADDVSRIVALVAEVACSTGLLWDVVRCALQDEMLEHHQSELLALLRATYPECPLLDPQTP